MNEVSRSSNQIGDPPCDHDAYTQCPPECADAKAEWRRRAAAAIAHEQHAPLTSKKLAAAYLRDAQACLDLAARGDAFQIAAAKYKVEEAQRLLGGPADEPGAHHYKMDMLVSKILETHDRAGVAAVVSPILRELDRAIQVVKDYDELLKAARGVGASAEPVAPSSPPADPEPSRADKLRAALEPAGVKVTVLGEANEPPAVHPTGDGWEENACYLLNRCPHTIRVREGGGPENLLHSFVHTFINMEQKLELAAPPPYIALNLKCRFGCTDPAVVLVEFDDGGCVCWPDRVQALCAQHWQTSEPIKGARAIASLAEPPPTARRIELLNLLEDRERKHDAFRLAEQSGQYAVELTAFDRAHAEVIDWVTDHADELLPLLRPAPPPSDVQRDAERYRWLRNGNDYERTGPMVVLCETEHTESDEHPMWGLAEAALDTAVDEARGAATKSAELPRVSPEQFIENVANLTDTPWPAGETEATHWRCCKCESAVPISYPACPSCGGYRPAPNG